jgi:hypothetical protein
MNQRTACDLWQVGEPNLSERTHARREERMKPLHYPVENYELKRIEAHCEKLQSPEEQQRYLDYVLENYRHDVWYLSDHIYPPPRAVYHLPSDLLSRFTREIERLAARLRAKPKPLDRTPNPNPAYVDIDQDVIARALFNPALRRH